MLKSQRTVKVSASNHAVSEISPSTVKRQNVSKLRARWSERRLLPVINNRLIQVLSAIGLKNKVLQLQKTHSNQAVCAVILQPTAASMCAPIQPLLRGFLLACSKSAHCNNQQLQALLKVFALNERYCYPLDIGHQEKENVTFTVPIICLRNRSSHQRGRFFGLH